MKTRQEMLFLDCGEIEYGTDHRSNAQRQAVYKARRDGQEPLPRMRLLLAVPADELDALLAAFRRRP